MYRLSPYTLVAGYLVSYLVKSARAREKFCGQNNYGNNRLGL
ncbi:hypothetical protein X474_23060 [Dethiosulfatarculus sandiegensis]|uniref:Uncharacterized protein n=1 Tax=Dethiosulfatarculus sandiegensis TaxID=1429043 RepID=A0A0D2JQA4_9BACT|nr:hypothetical protein X474_23060 [Dethiosulfatarculus sandiegensis]